MGFGSDGPSGRTGNAVDEAQHAAEVAEYLGTRHRQINVTADLDLLPQVVQQFDEPFSDPVVPAHLSALCRSQQARHRLRSRATVVTRALVVTAATLLISPKRSCATRSAGSGLSIASRGALGRFYPSAGWMPRALRLQTVLTNLGRSAHDACYHDVSRLRPELRAELLEPDFRRASGKDGWGGWFAELFAGADAAGANNALDRALYADTHSFLSEGVLVKVDRMSMAHGLEVRSPLLDYRLYELAATLPTSFKVSGRRTKRVLRRALLRHVPARVRAATQAGIRPTTRTVAARTSRAPRRPHAHDRSGGSRWDRAGAAAAPVVGSLRRRWSGRVALAVDAAELRPMAMSAAVGGES